MSRLEHATEIAGLAADLGLAGAANPVEAILRQCRTRIDRWLAEAGGVTTIGQLDALVTQRLEDQALVRAGMKALIQISEPLATIREASSYEEAVEAIKNTNFDIAFLDVDLKERKSGLDFLRHMRSLDLDTRAIMLSGISTPEIAIFSLPLSVLSDMCGQSAAANAAPLIRLRGRLARIGTPQ